MFVKSILDQKTPDLISVSPADAVSSVAALFKREGIGFALVHSDVDILIGTISERDIIHAMAEQAEVAGLPVVEIMTSNIVKCRVDDTLESVRQSMTTQRTRHVLAMDGGHAVGVVSIGDLIKHSLDECRIDSGHMMEYINGQGYQ